MLENDMDMRMLPILIATQTEEEATHIIQELIQVFITRFGETPEEAEKTVRINIGYLGGYATQEERARIERLFKVEHPFFGSIEKNGPPTMTEAFELGMAWGQQVRRREEGKKND